MGYTGNNHHAEKYDAKEAYNKDLSASARLHYLENNIHDKHAAKQYGDPAAKNITEVLSKGARHDAAPKMYQEPAAKMNDYGDPAGKEVTEASQKKLLASDANPEFKAAIAKEKPIKMAGDMGHNVLAEDMRSNQMAGASGEMGYAADASGAPAPMMKALGKPALMMKKGIASMCGMKK